MVDPPPRVSLFPPFPLNTAVLITTGLAYVYSKSTKVCGFVGDCFKVSQPVRTIFTLPAEALPKGLSADRPLGTKFEMQAKSLKEETEI